MGEAPGHGRNALSCHTGRRVWSAFAAGALALALIANLESPGSGWGWLHVISEYRGFERLYGGRAALVTAFQLLYDLLESAMVVLILASWQRAGELWTGLSAVPWGGAGLTLTWGVAHVASHPQGAIWVVVIAMVLGVVFLGARRSAMPALAVTWLAFIV